MASNDQLPDTFERPAQPDGSFTIVLDYPVKSRPRYPIGQTPHSRLNDLLSRNQARYRALLESFLPYAHQLEKIPATGETGGVTPYWINGFLPGLDAVAIYCLIAAKRPKYYFEIGSGNSTKFARRAIRDYGLSTQIVSIDPCPRAEIDEICDEVVRLPLEDCAPEFFNRLDDGDLLFVDDSHRCFMNSDVTVFFLEVLPNLKKNVTVGIHDIALPYDYPAQWSERYYSEQYLLACWLLAGTSKFEVLLPSAYASLDKSLAATLDDLWRKLPDGVERHGSAFWLQTQE
ncbi:MAG: class I SAM-dependent methyltransferase [Sulfuricellaceae bacterium]